MFSSKSTKNNLGNTLFYCFASIYFTAVSTVCLAFASREYIQSHLTDQEDMV